VDEKFNAPSVPVPIAHFVPYMCVLCALLAHALRKFFESPIRPEAIAQSEEGRRKIRRQRAT
jgi:hypothetical protein